MLYFVVIAASLGAGIIQSVTGFGSSIFMMLFFPFFFPVLRASSLASAITVVLNALLVAQYHKYIRFKPTFLPAVFYVITSSAAIYLAPSVDKQLMLRIFGIFLIVLSVYFLFFPNKVHIKASFGTASVCASLSGVANGWFGVGGPPMVIYFLAATTGKEEYLGTIRYFFLITGLYNMALRVGNGLYTLDLLPLTLLGIAGIAVGKAIGTRIIDRIDAEMMKKTVYVFLAISGVLNLI